MLLQAALTISLLQPFSLAQTCFNLDGSAITETDYQPCNSIIGTTSMCCATNRTIPAGTLTNGISVRDTCLSNGLCQNNFYYVAQTQFVYEYYREACSSPTWEGCLKNVCPGSTPGEGVRLSFQAHFLRSWFFKTMDLGLVNILLTQI
jgi:hypothetical protein